MTYQPHGNHFIAGQLVKGDEFFSSEPASGSASQFSVGRLIATGIPAEQAELIF